MKFRLIATSLVLGVLSVNAHAFKSISLQYPEGIPSLVNMEYSYSTGNCNLPSKDLKCEHSGLEVTLQGYAAPDFVQVFSNAHRNEIFKKDPNVNPNNYIKFSIPGKNNACTVNLKMNKDIVVNLNKNGTCTF